MVEMWQRKRQEHINANHSSEDESTAPKVKEEKIRPQQKKKKVKMYKSSLDSESEDNKMINHEVKKISRGITVNADAINDLSMSVMKQIKVVKNDLKSLEDQIMENTNHLEIVDQNFSFLTQWSKKP